MARIRLNQISVLVLIAALTSLVWQSTCAPVAAQSAREIRTISPNERLHLAAGTRVTVNGKITTLGAIRVAHAKRVREFAQAASLGESIALKIRGEHFQVASKSATISNASGKIYALHTVAAKKGGFRLETAVSSSGMLVGIASLHTGSASPVPKATTAPGQYRVLNPVLWPWWRNVIFGSAIIPIPKSTLQTYAKDYQDFCTAAQATACIYEPVVESWQIASSSNPVNNVYTLLTIVDPLITDPTVCQSEGGSVGQSGCVYKYPYVETTDFQPAASNPYVVNCPGGSNSWNISIDPHGAVSVYAYFGTWQLTSVATCVVQVYT